MGMESIFGRQTPWGRVVTDCNNLATLFGEGKNQICVSGDIRREWLLHHKVAVVDGKKRVIEFSDLGGDLWVARLYEHAKPPAPPAEAAAAAA